MKKFLLLITILLVFSLTACFEDDYVNILDYHYEGRRTVNLSYEKDLKEDVTLKVMVKEVGNHSARDVLESYHEISSGVGIDHVVIEGLQEDKTYDISVDSHEGNYVVYMDKDFPKLRTLFFVEEALNTELLNEFYGYFDKLQAEDNLAINTNIVVDVEGMDKLFYKYHLFKDRTNDVYKLYKLEETVDTSEYTEYYIEKVLSKFDYYVNSNSTGFKYYQMDHIMYRQDYDNIDFRFQRVEKIEKISIGDNCTYEIIVPSINAAETFGMIFFRQDFDFQFNDGANILIKVDVKDEKIERIHVDIAHVLEDSFEEDLNFEIKYAYIDYIIDYNSVTYQVEIPSEILDLKG